MSRTLLYKIDNQRRKYNSDREFIVVAWLEIFIGRLRLRVEYSVIRNTFGLGWS